MIVLENVILEWEMLPFHGTLPSNHFKLVQDITLTLWFVQSRSKLLFHDRENFQKKIPVELKYEIQQPVLELINC